MSRHQTIFRITIEEYHNLLLSYGESQRYLPYDKDSRIVAVVTNPYNSSVDIILEHPSLEEVPDFTTPKVIQTGIPAGPNDFAMEDSTKDATD